MENASKALIIAGAILLSISIIAIGMAVFNQAKEAMDGSGLSSEKAAAFNSKFDSYAGTQSGPSVKALLTTIQNHNVSCGSDDSLKIKVSCGTIKEQTDTTSIQTARTGIKSGFKYSVVFGYANETGYIDAVTITQTNSKTTNEAK